jgi:aminoglycoside phosphotransferase (APT) family kinase protein
VTDALAWAGAAAGSAVVAHEPLTGGMTSTMLALTHADGRRTVLREIDREPWLAHAAALTAGEATTQRLLDGTDVPAPRSLALDAPAGRHLMTLLPGRVRDDAAAEVVDGLAGLLARVHAVRPPYGGWPRSYQSWAWEAKHVVPTWAGEPAAWEAAFALLRTAPPPHEPTFLHRDLSPRNVLWRDDEVSGLVDWVETSTGPAWLDVAHCATNLALRHGTEAAEALAEAYVAVTGRAPQPYFDVMDVVGFLPPPGRPAMVVDPTERRRLEARLVAVLDRR